MQRTFKTTINDIYVSLVSHTHQVAAKGWFIAMVSTTVETENPEAEIKPGLDLLGPVAQKFVSVSDVYRPTDLGADSQEAAQQQWIKAIRRDDWVPNTTSNYSRVCSKHFRETDFTEGKRRRMKKGVIPTVFPDYPSSVSGAYWTVLTVSRGVRPKQELDARCSR
ncbi:hypothetical protein HPB52_000733 [Rhipicephalus sanguineus]|uniref:Rab GDP dissociation inhibitor n=1 Tax=Rhipicephalus sanguineus TaxID=34632 RepID=A0A9D4T6Z4_RHISA|nr:hypothetical protein HPB52_000733 [Rhipicephalus sanguineus]